MLIYWFMVARIAAAITRQINRPQKLVHKTYVSFTAAASRRLRSQSARIKKPTWIFARPVLNKSFLWTLRGRILRPEGAEMQNSFRG